MNETTIATPVTNDEINAFIEAVSKRHNEGLKAAYPTCEVNWETISGEPGRKYFRLVTSRGSAFAFVDMTNGDILKPAGWKTPAKHARGNIRKGDVSNLWNGAFTNNGGGLFVAYLR